jgi:hypothetical protein
MIGNPKLLHPAMRHYLDNRNTSDACHLAGLTTLVVVKVVVFNTEL